MQNQTITVTVKFLSVLAQLCNESETEIHLPVGATLRLLVNNLRESYPRINDFFQGEKPHRSFKTKINKKSFDETDGLDTVLHDGDHLTIFITLAGG